MRASLACVFLAVCLIAAAASPVYAEGKDTIAFHSGLQDQGKDQEQGQNQNGIELQEQSKDQNLDLGRDRIGLQDLGWGQDLDRIGLQGQGKNQDRIGSQMQAQPDLTGYKVARLYDYDSNLTLGRSLLPADFSSQYEFLNSLTSNGECSIDCPFQVVLTASDESQSRHFLYRSFMNYLYPSNPDFYFQDGQRFGSTEGSLIGYPTMVMMYPSSANEYADYIMEKLNPNGNVYYDGMNYVTEEDDPFLAQVSQDKMAIYNVSSPFDSLFDVDCTGAFTSYTESAYYVDDPDMPLSVKIVTSTTMLQFHGIDRISGGTCAYAITDVPYFYMCVAPASEKDEAFAQFDLFVATTRTTDEFAILNARESQMLHEIVDLGGTSMDEKELMEGLGEGYGTYYEDQFSDYIFDQNDYTTSGGESFKVPTSYDYVYETDDGEIYITNTTEQPTGSTRLYAN